MLHQGLRLYSVPRIHYFDQIKCFCFYFLFFAIVNEKQCNSLDGTNLHTKFISIVHCCPLSYSCRVQQKGDGLKHSRFEESAVAPLVDMGEPQSVLYGCDPLAYTTHLKMGIVSKALLFEKLYKWIWKL